MTKKCTIIRPNRYKLSSGNVISGYTINFKFPDGRIGTWRTTSLKEAKQFSKNWKCK